MPDAQRYTEHLDILIALTTHLALTTSQYKSRTVPNLVAELGLEAPDVRFVLETFPGLFRKSRGTTTSGEHYYSLRARRALRFPGEDNQPLPELRVDVLKALLEFVSQRAETEKEERQFQETLRHAVINTRIAAGGALVAAVATIVAAIISHHH